MGEPPGPRVLRQHEAKFAGVVSMSRAGAPYNDKDLLELQALHG